MNISLDSFLRYGRRSFCPLFLFWLIPLFVFSNATITSPASGTTVQKGSVLNINVATSDPNTCSVLFYVNGTGTSRDYSAPYSFTLFTSSVALPVGLYTFGVQAEDCSTNPIGARNSIVIDLVSPGGGPPPAPPPDAPPPPPPAPGPGGGTVTPTYVYLIDPPPGQKFDIGTVVGVSAIGGGDAGIQKVCFSAQGPSSYNLGCQSTSPYSVAWNTANVVPGVYTIGAVATDNNGTNVPSQSRIITLTDPPPTVLLISPASNAQIPRGSTNPIILTMQAFDNIGVVSTSFLVDGATYGPTGSPDANGFYRVPWDVSSEQPGQHIITAIAKDTRGQVPVPSPSVVVTIGDSPPVVEISTPGATANRVAQPVPIIATAQDDVDLVSVQFSFQAASGGTEQSLGTDLTFPYQVAWNTLLLTPGGYILKAIAKDDQGQTTTAIKTVTLLDARPNVEISTPVEPVLRSVNKTPVIATADDDVELISVTFSFLPAGGGAKQPLGSKTTAPYRVDWDTAPLTPGAYVLEAIAKDDVNQTRTDTQTVQVYDTPPVITFTNPRSGAAVLGGTVPLQVDASDNMPGLKVRFYINDAFVSEDTSAPFEYSWNTAGTEGFFDIRAEAIDDLGQKTNAGTSVTVVRPRITSFNPTGDVVTDTVNVDVALPANISIDSVRLLVNGADTGLSVSEAPFTFPWDTTAYANGNVTLVARATQGSITSDSDPVSVTISNIGITFTGNGTTNPQINAGENLALTWNAAGASSCNAASSPQNNQWRASTPLSTSGTVSISGLTENSIFSLRCTTAQGILSSKSVSVTVGTQLPACSTLVTGGITPTCSSSCGGQVLPGACSGTQVCCLPPPVGGGTPPSVTSFSATPANLPQGGGSVTVQWATSGSVANCEAVSTPRTGWNSTTLAPSGTQTVVGVTSGTNFSIQCIGPTGLRSQSRSVAVQVVGTPPPGGNQCGATGMGVCIPNALCVTDSASCPMGETCTIGTTGTGMCAASGNTCCVPTATGPMMSEGLVPCGTGDDPSAAEECRFEHLLELAKRVINFLLFVIAVPLAALSFAFAGYLYLTAAGNESRVQQAHSIFFYVVLGLCLALAAWLIINAILLGLGVKTEFNFLKASMP